MSLAVQKWQSCFIMASVQTATWWATEKSKSNKLGCTSSNCVRRDLRDGSCQRRQQAFAPNPNELCENWRVIGNGDRNVIGRQAKMEFREFKIQPWWWRWINSIHRPTVAQSKYFDKKCWSDSYAVCTIPRAFASTLTFNAVILWNEMIQLINYSWNHTKCARRIFPQFDRASNWKHVRGGPLRNVVVTSQDVRTIIPTQLRLINSSRRTVFIAIAWQDCVPFHRIT